MADSTAHSVVNCESLGACLQQIKRDHVGAPVAVPTFAALGGDPVQPQEVPRFLFRGENGLYPTLFSSMERLLQDDSLDDVDREQVVVATKAIDERLRTYLHMSPVGASALLQHYGLPTEVIDVTTSLEVAAFFAVLGARQGRARILVLDAKQIVRSASLLDMAEVAFAVRPRTQCGFGIFSQRFRNLRSQGFLDAVAATDYIFPVSGEDAGWLRMSHELLLDLHDPTRAILAHLLDCMVRNSGSFTYRAARWLAEHVPPSPYTVDGLECVGANEIALAMVSRPGRPEPYDQLFDQQLNTIRWAQGPV